MYEKIWWWVKSLNVRGTQQHSYQHVKKLGELWLVINNKPTQQVVNLAGKFILFWIMTFDTLAVLPSNIIRRYLSSTSVIMVA